MAERTLLVLARPSARIAVAAFAALIGGLALALAFPPYACWWLIAVGFVPVAVAEARLLPPKLSGVGAAIATFTFFVVYAHDLNDTPHTPLRVRALPLSAALVALALTRWTRTIRRRLGPILASAFVVSTWVGIEVLRSFDPVGATWGFIAYALWAQPWLIQPVSVLGTYGLAFVVLLVNATIALVAIAWLDRGVPALCVERESAAVELRALATVVVATTLIVALWIGCSLAMLRSPTATLRVAALQPGLTRPLTRDEPEAQRAQLLERLVAQSRQAAASGAKVIVWPEAALAFDPRARDAGLAKLAQETGAYLFVGYAIDTDAGLRNEVVAIAPDGTILGVHRKRHPVVGYGETSVGSLASSAPYATPLGVLGAIICFDLDFTDTVRDAAARGARVIAVPSWDWAGAAHKHYTHLVFRAVEARAVMIKSEQAFDSAIVDPWGRIVARTVSTEPRATVLVADVPVVDDAPLGVAIGDGFGWLCAATAVGLAALAARRA
ncbi:MAG: nitrilase-related carbon-nitrogen hydrolase [Polyangiales bacterium]